MLGSKKSAFSVSGSTTLISPDTVVHGDLHFSGNLDIEGLVQGKLESFRIAAVHARNVVQRKDRREQHARRQGQMKKRAAFPFSVHHGRVHIFPTYFAWRPTGDKKVVNILVSG